MKRQTQFETIRSEGGLLPTELLQRVREADKDLGGLRGEDYGLPPNEPLNEAIVRSWNRLVGAWGSFQEARAKLADDDAGTTVTRERWLLVLLQELGYGRVQIANAVVIDGKSYAVSHAWGNVPIHLVGCRVDLGSRSRGVAGAATKPPHGTLQELLNRSDERLWGVVSNGLQLRLLRDNSSLTRQAYVEFDLEAMLDGEAYADFALLWLVCHASRVEGKRPHDCWLETWSQEAARQGTRALDGLRNGVEIAITALGSGFLQPGTNPKLKDALRVGELTTQDYYRQLLRLVYRLLFLFVAEDRQLLHDPAATDEARERYAQWYSTQRLRDLAGKRRGTKHTDLWQALRLVMDGLGDDEGRPELGLPPLGSYLWSGSAIEHLESSTLANRSLLEAVRALATVRDDKVLRTVDYKNLGAEELGSVYESLLELHPELDPDTGSFALTTAVGNERKTTGSYYTPSSLIAVLLDSALDPVLDEAAAKGEEAILDLKVCDPACGSGHFLVAAAHRIAKRLASVRTGDEEPSPEATRVALRDVVSRCLYGVDVNPMAVELCKVSLWMEALDPGRPLSFLDAHIKCGNSLLGTTAALMADGIPDDAFKPLEGDDKEVAKALRKQNKTERAGQLSLEDAAIDLVSALQSQIARLEQADDASPDALHAKERLFRDLLQSDAYECAKLAADAWCAAFVQPKQSDAPRITTGLIRRIVNGKQPAAEEAVEEIGRLAAEYAFFHWEVEFPGVFGEVGQGFDVVTGNPPYVDSEVLKRDEPRMREFVTSTCDAATGNWDLFVPFVAIGPRTLRQGGHQALLTPIKIIASDYAQGIQQTLLALQLIAVHDFSRMKAFEDADVSVCSVAFSLEMPEASNEVAFLAYAEDGGLDRRTLVSQEDLLALPAGYLCFPLSSVRVPTTILREGMHLNDVATFSDGASTSEAYQIRELVEDLGRPWEEGDEANWLRLVNTGTIDPFVIRWGTVVTRYLKTQWQYPVVSLDGLRATFPRRAMQGESPKIIVAGLASRIEAVADHGTVLCGKSAVLVLPNTGVCPFALCVTLNASVSSDVYRALFGLRGFSISSMAIGPRQLEQLPIPTIMAALLRPADSPVPGELQPLQAAYANGGLQAAMDEAILSSIGQIIHLERQKGQDTMLHEKLAEEIIESSFVASVPDPTRRVVTGAR